MSQETKPKNHNNDLKTISDLWPCLHPWQRKVLVIRAFFLALPNCLRHLHPADLVIPAMLAQVIVFVLAVLSPPQAIFTIAIGNLVIVALAMSPLLVASQNLQNVPRA